MQTSFDSCSFFTNEICCQQCSSYWYLHCHDWKKSMATVYCFLDKNYFSTSEINWINLNVSEFIKTLFRTFKKIQCAYFFFWQYSQISMKILACSVCRAPTWPCTDWWREKDFTQKGHWNGFSPVCLRMWFFRLQLRSAMYGQKLHG